MITQLGRALLSIVTHPSDRAYLLADLDVERARRTVVHGRRAADQWYRRQLRSSLWPSLRRRLAVRRRTLVGSTPNRIPTGVRLMDQLRLDLRYAFRMLSQRPAFTVVAILTLSLGIGANATIFSLVNGVFFKGVPGLEQVEGLVEISRTINGGAFDLSYPVFTHLRSSNDVLDDMAALAMDPVALRDRGAPTVYLSLSVTGNYFTMLRLAPSVGRFFAEDEGLYPHVRDVVVISHRLWQRRFGGSMDAIGRTVWVNGHALQLVGVMPRSFHGHAVGLQFDLWVPLGAPIPGLPTARSLDQPSSAVIEVIGRLRDQVSTRQAATALSTLGAAFLANTHDAPNADRYAVRVARWAPVPAIIRGGVTAFVSVLMVVVGLVLTMACTNVANMMLARATTRRSEIAVRLALGASRTRVIRQLLTEALVLFLGAGAIGMLVGMWGTHLLAGLQPPLPPGFTIELDLRPDLRVFAFAFVVSAVTGVVFGLAPALRASRTQLVPALKAESGTQPPSRARLRSLLVGAQAATSFLLLIVAGLFLRSLSSLHTLDPGWRTDGVATMDVDLEMAGYSEQRARTLYDDLLARVRALQGVESAALAHKLPLGGRSSFGDVTVPGAQPPEGRSGFQAFLNRVTDGYFETLGLTLLEGRGIQPTDGPNTGQVAVINQAMADRLWPSGNAIGSRFYINQVATRAEIEVVGVVENAKYGGLTEETPNFYYLPVRQWFNLHVTLHVFSSTPAASLPDAMRAALRSLDLNLPVPEVLPLAESLAFFSLPQRLAAWVSGIMGAIGLALSALGVYGVTAFVIGQRTREIGVRLALGANTGDVIRMTLRQGLTAPILGMMAGLAVALALTRFLQTFLAIVTPVDPLTFAATGALLVTVAAVAAFVPATRAAQLDPAATLRTH